MLSCWLVVVIVGLLAKQSQAVCPHEASGLTTFSTAYTGLTKSSDVAITSSILLDVALVDVNTITVSGSGKLVFDQGINITVKTKGIMVQNNSALYIGSEECPHEDNVNIILQGIRTANRSLVGEEGEKYIAVQDQGTVHIHGSKRIPWTKLSGTVERFSLFANDTSKVKYYHQESDKVKVKKSKEGPAMYVISNTAEIVSFDVYDFYETNNLPKEQTEVDRLETDLNNIADGNLVAISIQNFWDRDAGTNVSSLLNTIESVTGMSNGELLLRDMEKFDAFSMMFVKGGAYVQSVDPLISKETTATSVSMEFAGYKISASASVDPNAKAKSLVDFRILSLDLGYPVVTVTDDITSWSPGLEVLMVSTDYKSSHAEVRKIKEILTDKSFSLSDELFYRHYGEIEHNVDMRGEVALVTRNIRIEGEMSRGCPSSNENCDKVPFDSYGGHFKVLHGFGEVFIEGAELVHMGQPSNKGVYPMHFHMCKDISGKVAVLKQNSIHDTFQRAITIHGTWGTSPESPGVTLDGNVAYNVFGHCYFLEDGAEAFTIIKNNLGAHIKKIDNGFFSTDLKEPAVFWITTPEVYMVNNVAAGGEGTGLWCTYPMEPVGPSAGFVYQHGQVYRTPLWLLDNNVAHSNMKTGLNMEKVVQNEHGDVDSHFTYEPRVDPLNETSALVKVQVTRMTAYKNMKRNAWTRGGLEFMQLSSAESRFGVLMARGTKRQQQFLRNSIFIGISEGNSEPEGYPDAITPQDLDPDETPSYSASSLVPKVFLTLGVFTKTKTNIYIYAVMQYFLGVGFIYGPQYISDSWFKGFKSADDHSYVGGGLSFKPKAEFPVSQLTAVFSLRFAYADPTEGNRVFVGNTPDFDLGFSNGNGNEISSFRDLDGTVYACDAADFTGIKQFIKPEKFLLTDNCKCRMNQQMCYCDDQYGSVRATAKEVWSGSMDDFQSMMQFKRIKYADASDVAYENHESNISEPRALLVLGDNAFYYEIQMVNDFAKEFSVEVDGVELGHDVVVGMCFPEGTVKEDFDMKARSGEEKVLNDDFIWGSSLQEVRDDDNMTTVFLDGRMLYMHFTSTAVRDPKYTTERCLGGSQCPNFVFTFTGSSPRSYSPCLTITEEMLDTDNMLSTATLEDCVLPSSNPEANWGTGDTQASHDGGYGYWSLWSDCVDGTRTRTRVCDSPTPFGGGQDCPAEDAVETQDC